MLYISFSFARELLADPMRLGERTAVVPFYTNNSEEIYATTVEWYSFSGKFISDNFRDFENGKFWILPLLLPLSIIGLGFVIIPRPVKLDLFIGKPVIPLPNETAASFAARVKTAMQNLINEAQAKNPIVKEKNWISMVCNHPFYVLYIIVQNTFMWSFFILAYLSICPFLIPYGFLRNFFR